VKNGLTNFERNSHLVIAANLFPVFVLKIQEKGWPQGFFGRLWFGVLLYEKDEFGLGRQRQLQAFVARFFT
jgi:hypothetical protein